jgi:hypothetical protein
MSQAEPVLVMSQHFGSAWLKMAQLSCVMIILCSYDSDTHFFSLTLSTLPPFSYLRLIPYFVLLPCNALFSF